MTAARPTEPIIDNRYRLLRGLGRGGMGEVFCALDRLTGEQVALKRVALSAEQPESELGPMGFQSSGQNSTLVAVQRPTADGSWAPTRPLERTPERGRKDALRVALAQEFHTLASLRHPNIISVLDYGFDAERRPYFTMELLRDARPLLAGAAELPLPRKVALLGQLLLALSYLHRRGVLHRDLKPSNALVVTGPDGPQLKVLDFGLALGRDGQQLRAEVAGTLGYLSPEVLLGSPPSEAADLYAVGVIAYEVLTGTDPFEKDDDETLLRLVIERGPDLTALAPLGGLADFVARLIDRAPEARFPSAAAALDALSAASGGMLASESAAVRESFLQAAPLVGRAAEWAVLRGRLDRLTAGMGGGLLIAGESGVGKSRLLDELRAHALVRGARVVRGQAVSSGGGAYRVFRDALPPLCLSAPLPDEQASVLQALVQDLPALLERPLPAAPEVEAHATQLRLRNAFEALLSQQLAPTVLLLEDLHWADGESLALIERALAVAQSRPLLVVGTFRDDECPQLPSELPAAEVLKVRRLPGADIAELCRTMLGTVPPPHLLALVAQETEGNVFFVVEVMRALAEEAGGLSAVGRHALPAHVLTGGIRAVLLRRIERVPEPARPLLRLAAVAGRQLDVLVLGVVEPRLSEWLGQCSEAAVLEVSEQRWRFTHDKLREALLAELLPDERRELHRRVVWAIQAAYPDHDAHAAELAYHCGEAGQDREAARYGVIAGEQALLQGALEQAVALLEQATARMEARGESTPLEWARAYRLQAQAQFALGRMQDVVAACEKMLLRLDHSLWLRLRPWPLAQQLGMLGLAARHALQKALPRPLPPQPPSGTSEAHGLRSEMLRLRVILGETYAYLGRSLDLLWCVFTALEGAQEVGDLTQLALTTAVAGFMLNFTPLRGLSRRYLDHAEALAQLTQDRRAEAQASRIGGLVLMLAGEWEQSIAVLERSVALWRQLGDDLLLMFCIGQLVTLYSLRGDRARMEAWLDELGRVAARGRHARNVLWWQARAAVFASRRGQHVEARAVLLDCRMRLGATQDRVVEITVEGGLAAAALRSGDLAAARGHADAVLALTPQSVTGYNYMDPLFEVLNVYLAIWEAGEPTRSLRVSEAQLGQARALLRRYARAIVIGRPQASVIESRFAWLAGQPAAAVRDAEAGLALATRLGMPLEQALAHVQLGYLLRTPWPRSGRREPPPSSPARAADHLRAAAALFRRVGDEPRARALEADL